MVSIVSAWEITFPAFFIVLAAGLFRALDAARILSDTSEPTVTRTPFSKYHFVQNHLAVHSVLSLGIQRTVLLTPIH